MLSPIHEEVKKNKYDLSEDDNDTKQEKQPVNDLPIREQIVEQQIPLKYNVHDIVFPDGIMKIKLMPTDALMFSNTASIYIGQYTINDIFNYLFGTKQLDTTTITLIEKTICTKTNDDRIFELKTSSPMLFDIDILVILNKLLAKFENTGIAEYDEKNAKIIRIFICQLLSHTLNVIAKLSHEIKHKEISVGNDSVMKAKLIKKSIGIVFRLSQYANKNITEATQKYEQLMSTIKRVEETKTKIDHVD